MLTTSTGTQIAEESDEEDELRRRREGKEPKEGEDDDQIMSQSMDDLPSDIDEDF